MFNPSEKILLEIAKTAKKVEVWAVSFAFLGVYNEILKEYCSRIAFRVVVEDLQDKKKIFT